VAAWRLLADVRFFAVVGNHDHPHEAARHHLSICFKKKNSMNRLRAASRKLFHSENTTTKHSGKRSVIMDKLVGTMTNHSRIRRPFRLPLLSKVARRHLTGLLASMAR